MLTACLPATSNEVNEIHAKIYGINTLGAFVGVVVAALLFIPNLGLSMSLLAGGLINLIIGAVFCGNRLEGEIKKSEVIPQIENNYPNWLIYCFVFVVGSVSIAMEVLTVRSLSLAMGSGFWVFPMVLGVFVLGLAMGSLTLYRTKLTRTTIQRSMAWLGFYLPLFYLTVQFWPSWVHHIRIQFSATHASAYLYFFSVFVMLCFLCFPFLVPMGRLLPVGYSLIPKDGSNYGSICGKIYFANTIGTVFGSIVLGHLLLYVLDLDSALKIVISLMGALFLAMNFKSAPVFRYGMVALLLFAFLVPRWDRSDHEVGLFRKRVANPSLSYKGVFSTARGDMNNTVPFFEDGPNTSVTVLVSSESNQSPESRTIYVNGKSDSNTYGDFETMVNAAVIPYLYSPVGVELKTLIVGLGTGLTAGYMGMFSGVSDVEVLEISPALIEAAPHFDEYNKSVMTNQKIRIVETDAFRYFARHKDKFDIIVSEPSNPWVNGVENLFSLEYYSHCPRSFSR